MDTYTLAQEFSYHCYSRGLRPKTLEFYKWGTTKLVKRCPAMPTDAAQVNVVFDDPALGRRSRENLERAIRAFLAWAEERHGCPNPLRGVKRMPKTSTGSMKC